MFGDVFQSCHYAASVMYHKRARCPSGMKFQSINVQKPITTIQNLMGWACGSSGAVHVDGMVESQSCRMGWLIRYQE
jgi:hypothetical protein